MSPSLEQAVGQTVTYFGSSGGDKLRKLKQANVPLSGIKASPSINSVR